MQIIVAATKTAAHVCQRDDLGTLAAGQVADILVVEGNPLDHLHALLQVRLVIKEGIIIRDATSKP